MYYTNNTSVYAIVASLEGTCEGDMVQQSPHWEKEKNMGVGRAHGRDDDLEGSFERGDGM